LLANKTQIEQHGNLHPEFSLLCQLAKAASPFFEKLSEKAPTLSFTKFLAVLRQQSSWLDADESNHQVIRPLAKLQ
jgi:hypothetical protein